ncbi:MAG: hypothetical protein HY246_23000 [Proteobacteria bacterium]|nr:hypothetical protein [Pseudomonadota bacterium]
MQVIIYGLFLAIGIASAPAAAQPFHAGVTRLTVQDSEPFDVLIAYPTEAAEGAVENGPFTLMASRDAPVAAGAHFPAILFSHGSGRGPGTPLEHFHIE